MIKTKKVFPNVDLEVKYNPQLDMYTLIISSWLRVQNKEGVWYLNPHLQRWESRHEVEEDDMSKGLNLFTTNLWMFKHLGNVDTEYRDLFGNSVFVYDQCQLSEEERLKLIHDGEPDPSKPGETSGEKKLLDSRIGKKYRLH